LDTTIIKINFHNLIILRKVNQDANCHTNMIAKRRVEWKPEKRVKPHVYWQLA
jgi:hypothetical protein